MTRAVMQQALDALIEIEYARTDKSEGMALTAITDLRAALAQQDDPVAWAHPIGWHKNPRAQSEQVVKITRNRQAEYGFTEPLYASQQPAPVAQQDEPLAQPLTEEWINDAADRTLDAGTNGCVFGVVDFAREIERAHKIGGPL